MNTIHHNMKNILCRLFGHKYRLLRKITPTVREVKCKRCEMEFGMNDEVKALVPMDGEIRVLHKMLKEPT